MEFIQSKKIFFLNNLRQSIAFDYYVYFRIKEAHIYTEEILNYYSNHSFCKIFYKHKSANIILHTCNSKRGEHNKICYERK